MYTVVLNHLRAGTITAAERRYLLFACRVKLYALIRAAAVSG